MHRGLIVASQCQPEVGQHQPAVRHPQYILWRHVAVNDCDRVHRRKTTAQLANIAQALGERARARCHRRRTQHLAQRSAGRQFHRDKPVAVRVSQLEHPAHIGMTDRARDLHFAGQSFDPALLACALRMQDLHRDQLAKNPVPRAIHRAAASLAKRRLDLVSLREDESRADLLGRAGARPPRDLGVLITPVGDVMTHRRINGPARK